MGAAEGKTKEGRKLIRSYQKKHRTLTVSKDARHMARLFNLYGGKKGYLDYNEAKIFVRDVLKVCELLDDFSDPEQVVNGVVRELDPLSTNKVYLSELLKPSWGRVQDVLHVVSEKMKQLHTDPPPRPTSRPVIILPAKSPTKILNSAEVIYESPSISESELEENCPPSFICPITTEIMTDPVILVETGTTYDRSSIHQWLENHDTDPSTGLKIISKEMIPVLALKNAIEEWKQDLIDRQKERKEKILQKQQKKLALSPHSQPKNRVSEENEEKPIPLSESKIPDHQLSGSPSVLRNESIENSSNENEARSSEENNIPPEVSQIED